MGEDTAGPPSGRRVSVDEAARALGLTVDAVRKRVQRGTITHEKDGAGRVRIILDGPDNTSTLQDESPDTGGAGRALLAAKDGTIEDLRARVAFLERELARRGDEANTLHRIVAGLTQANTTLAARMPELEAPQEPPQDTETVEEGPEPQPDARGAHGGAQGAERRPWWRRVFGG